MLSRQNFVIAKLGFLLTDDPNIRGEERKMKNLTNFSERRERNRDHKKESRPCR